MLKRLITQKDKFYIGSYPINNFHKFCGLLVLLNYAYRFYEYVVYGEIYTNFSPFNVFTLFIHFITSISSLIFHVLTHKNPNSSYHIWREMRLHNILFATRQLAVIVLAMLFDHCYINMKFFSGLKYFALLVVHLLADQVTRQIGNQHVRTIRGDLSESSGLAKRLGGYFYSFSQLNILGIMLNRNTDIINTAFFSLVVIQIAALLMTLSLKRLITNRTANIVYSLAIVIAYIAAYYNTYDGILWRYKNELLLIFVVGVLRFGLRVNKYLLWVLFTVTVNLCPAMAMNVSTWSSSMLNIAK